MLDCLGAQSEHSQPGGEGQERVGFGDSAATTRNAAVGLAQPLWIDISVVCGAASVALSARPADSPSHRL